MFSNYIIVAFRNLKRHKAYASINIVGLAIGMACCLVIFLFVRDELSYDKYHADLERIYRVAQESRSATDVSASATVCAASTQVIKDNFPQVEKVARVLPLRSGLIKRGDKTFYEEGRMYADTELFGVLTIPFLRGDPKTALDRPATVVLSRRMAEKYFGPNEAVGETISINSQDFEITGIVADAPANTHLKYDFILSLETLEGRYPFDRWFLSNFYTYIKLVPNVDMAVLSEQLGQIAHTYAKEELDQLGENLTYFLQPLADIHLHSHLRFEAEPPGQPLYLYVFSAVGLLVLIIACVNFINLSTARSCNRAKEVGMRKVVGATRRQLIWQFLGESFFATAVSLLLAVALVGLFLPLVNHLTGKFFVLSNLIHPVLLSVTLAIGILVGLAAGGYPAFVLSRWNAVSSLKGTLVGNARGSIIRKVLVVSQFTISIILVTGTIIVYQQLSYMRGEYLGFEKEQKLIIPVRGTVRLGQNYESVKNEFLSHASIVGATASSHVPGQRLNRWDTRLIGGGERQYFPMNYLYVDADFIPDYQIKMVAGRLFQLGMGADSVRAFIINETAVETFGWSTAEEVVGKQIEGLYEGEIIGVSEDFHYRGLQAVVEPLVLEFRPAMFGALSLTVNTGDLHEVISFAESKWRELYPNNPFEYFFLDGHFDRQYHSEQRAGTLLSVLTALGLLIACLGLLGLISFIATQRTKEIGIRKTLGASVSGIVVLLARDVASWVALATLFAWPIAWVVMNGWLQDFAYRIDVSWEVFFLAGLVALILALLTVSFQTVKAALANPVDSLACE